MKKLISLLFFVPAMMTLQSQNLFAPADSCVIDSVTAVPDEAGTVCVVTAYPQTKNRDYYSFALVDGFNPCEGQTPEEGMLTVVSSNSLSAIYHDNYFGYLPDGYYAYAVRKDCEDGGSTDWVYSNIVAKFPPVNYSLEVLVVETSGDTVHPDTVFVTLDGGNCAQTFHYQQVSYNGFLSFDSVSKGNYYRTVNVPTCCSVSDSLTLNSDTSEVIILHKPTLVPFNEDWSSGSFEAGGWQHDTGWIIENGKEAEAPWVAFRPENTLNHYERTLTSRLITNSQDAGIVTLSFDMRLDNINETGNEQLEVQLNTNGTWTTVAVYKNNGNSTEWHTVSVALRQITSGDSFQIRFVAKGENSDDMEAWNIDNIFLDKSCDAPVYGWGSPVYSQTSMKNSISWQVPQSAFSSLISHDKGLADQEDAFDLNSDFSVATVIYSPDFDVIPDPFTGLKISSIRFYLYDTAFQSLAASVWIGNNNSGPDSLIWTTEVTGTTPGSWIEVPVDTDIVIQNGKVYYSGYSVKGNLAGHFPAGMDTLSSNEFSLDYIDNGNGWEENNQYTMHQWKIQTLLQGQNRTEDNFPDYFLIFEENCDNEAFGIKDTVYSISGQMVYTTLLEKDCPRSTDLFKIKAHRPGDDGGCLSDFGYYNNLDYNFIDVTWESVNENQNSGNRVNVFPNPANDLVNIRSSEEIISVALFNRLGQKISEQSGDRQHQMTINTKTITSGVCFVAVKTKSGIVTKKVIVTRR